MLPTPGRQSATLVVRTSKDALAYIDAGKGDRRRMAFHHEISRGPGAIGRTPGRAYHLARLIGKCSATASRRRAWLASHRRCASASPSDVCVFAQA